MSQITDWAIELAEYAAPYEVDIAPDIVEAYLEGGASKETLFQQTDTSIAGGFGLGDAVALLPWILKGIAGAAKWILSILSAESTSNALGVVKDVKALLAEGDKEKAKTSVQKLPDTDAFDMLKQIIKTIRAELKKAGIPDDEADVVTLRVVVALLDNPQGTAAFIEQIEATS